MAIENKRPPMYQPYTPFVEFYINNVDVLRSPDGKPRTLRSFTHTVFNRGNGNWILEVFDPSFVAIEELMLTTRGQGVDIAEDAYDKADEDTNKEDEDITQQVFFRYGYVAQDGKVISASPSNGDYYVGAIISYNPTFKTNGTLLRIEGMNLEVSDITMSKKYDRHFYNTPIYDIIKEICRRQEWVFVPLLEPEGVEELPVEKQPEVLTDTSEGIDTTEEQPRCFTIGPDESPYKFVNRLCNYARPKDNRYMNFECRLEYRAKKTENQENSETKKDFKDIQGYLIFGPEDYLVKPVRTYVYMTDSTTDVISFSPNISGFAAHSLGGLAAVTLTDDVRTGDMAVHELNETDRNVKYFRKRRLKTLIDAPTLQAIQEGDPEFPDDVERKEGANTGPNVLTIGVKPDPDGEVKELPTSANNRFYSDRESITYWLSVQNFVNTARLEIFGDPSPEISPSNLIALFFFVPVDEDQYRIHYTSSIWNILGVVHNISDGMYTTTLELARNGLNGAGVSSEALYASLLDYLPEGAIDRVGGLGGASN